MSTDTQSAEQRLPMTPLVTFIMVSILAASVAQAQESASHPFSPFLKTYCLKCHGPTDQGSDLRLDTLAADFSDPLTASKWAEVANAINGHSMPPPDEKQPPVKEAAKFAEWLEQSLAKAEIAKRATRIVMRRMNRAEYTNTIRDLVGVDFDASEIFPEDPSAGGFDNIGAALSMSPLQMELYYDAARDILDHALVEGPKPETIKWHFEPEENTQGTDRLRVNRGKFRVLLNDGANTTENGFTVVHHNAWNKNIGFRDFEVPVEGEYIIRFRAAGRVPDREAVVDSARSILDAWRKKEFAKNPKGKKYQDQRVERDSKHFATHDIYNYGPPRVKVSTRIGGTPRVITELDVAATEAAPEVYEVQAHFTTERAGVKLENTYSVPKVLENFWMQNNDEFARPTLLVDWIELEGPIHPQWPPASHSQILFDSPNKRNEARYAREVIERFMTRAYRRPVTKTEVDAKVSLFTRLRKDKPSFVEAVKVPLAAVLASPNFLFLAEPEAPGTSPRQLTAYELASRLSYFLWSTMPDDDLIRAAKMGRLSQSGELKAQIRRMLTDDRSAEFVGNFAGQWLGLRQVGANPPVENLYPRYDRHLEVSMVKETKAFFAEVLHNDLDARELIQSDFVTINERMARFYGIANVKGDHFRRVSAPRDSHRGGLVTQASIHCITSNGTRTSPVTRGVWVMKTLLGTDPGLPVANVGEIPNKVPGIDKATVRERLSIHRENAACARCHDKIDPLGFALENFNASGEWRDQEGHGYNGRIGKNDPVIDASATMPDGTKFNGVEGLQQELRRNEDLFLNALASRMTTYALGRELGFSDRATVREIIASMKKNNYTLRSMIEAIVMSEQFKTK